MSGFVPLFPGSSTAPAQAWPPRSTSGRGFVPLGEYFRAVQAARPEPDAPADPTPPAAVAPPPADEAGPLPAPPVSAPDLAAPAEGALDGDGSVAEPPGTDPAPRAAFEASLAALETSLADPPPVATWLAEASPPEAPAAGPPAEEARADALPAPHARTDPGASDGAPAPDAAEIEALKRRAIEEARLQGLQEARERAQTELAEKMRAMEREIERLRLEAARTPSEPAAPAPASPAPADADDGRVALLERQIARLAGALEAAERQRDEAQRVAAALEYQGPGLFANVRDPGLKADDPNREKKLSLMKTIQAENRALREALGRPMSPVAEAVAAPSPPVAAAPAPPAEPPPSAHEEPPAESSAPETDPDDLEWQITPLADLGDDGPIPRIDVSALIGREPPPRERG